ncbi:MAG: hypothetical protein OEU32_18790 [Acidimicrobiia bacterium]|nr:hypothetical protein [Acidimicrobiia bacterium]
MSDIEFSVSPDIEAGVARAVHNIGTVGASWTAAERIAIAASARRAFASSTDHVPSVLPDGVAALAARTATAAHDVTVGDVNAFDQPEAFVELVGVVARTTAIDTFCRGIGRPAPALVATDEHPPTGRVHRGAKRRSAYVPTVGPAGATTALSAVPAEDAAQADLHGALYLTYAEMGDLHIVKGLPRWQLELVAARTSLINRCFF